MATDVAVTGVTWNIQMKILAAGIFMIYGAKDMTQVKQYLANL